MFAARIRSEKINFDENPIQEVLDHMVEAVRGELNKNGSYQFDLGRGCSITIQVPEEEAGRGEATEGEEEEQEEDDEAVEDELPESERKTEEYDASVDGSD